MSGPPAPRLIPAHAGKTCSAAADRRSCPAHPRSRGENLRRSSDSAQENGSSPLTRGKPRQCRRGLRCLRLIPAHAGKTSCPHPATRAPQAHPRSRGENLSEQSARVSAAGSSPLTRGKRSGLPCVSFLDRLIPAHAGKTSPRTTPRSGRRAHPRSRGENDPPGNPGLPFVGSSPLTRGKQREEMGPPPDRGLIPAHAGKTGSHTATAARPAAHPRSRGENLFASMVIVPSWGSSPLTRGKRDAGPPATARERLIPAHAGKTRAKCNSSNPARAHPRSRGENTNM